MTQEKLKITLMASIYYHEGRPVMQLRRFIKDKKLMKLIAKRIEMTGKCELIGEIRVRNPISAQIRLRGAGLL